MPSNKESMIKKYGSYTEYLKYMRHIAKKGGQVKTSQK